MNQEEQNRNRTKCIDSVVDLQGKVDHVRRVLANTSTPIEAIYESVLEMKTIVYGLEDLIERDWHGEA